MLNQIILVVVQTNIPTFYCGIEIMVKHHQCCMLGSLGVLALAIYPQQGDPARVNLAPNCVPAAFNHSFALFIHSCLEAFSAASAAHLHSRTVHMPPLLQAALDFGVLRHWRGAQG